MNWNWKQQAPPDRPRRICGREAAGNYSARSLGLEGGLAELENSKPLDSTPENLRT